MKEVLPGFHSWSVFIPERNLDFNGFFLVDSVENVLVDPPALSPADGREIIRLGAPGTILLTNRDHVRRSRECRDLFRCRIGIHELDAPLLDFQPDFVFGDGDPLPGSLSAVHVPDNKSPGETALLRTAGDGILILGDALIGTPSGGLTLLPPSKYRDLALTRAGLRRLLDHRFRSILIGDGPLTPIRGRSALERFVEEG